MRVRVATDACISSGNCARIAPEIFTQDDAEGVVVLLDAAPATGQQHAVRDAAAQCPVAAILLDHPD